MSVPKLVADFYQRIWEAGDLAAALEIVSPDVVFRGSLGDGMRGREAFLTYVRSIRSALDDYRCEILACVAEGDHAFVKVRFSGRHVGMFRGYSPSGVRIEWLGAALFRFDRNLIAELWVLGDLAGLNAWLEANSASANRTNPR